MSRSDLAHPNQEQRHAERFAQSGPALTFDDVLILPRWSEILPADCDPRSTLAPGLTLHLPLLSAAMDTVTETQMAIAMARLGGIGVLHKNQGVRAQADAVAAVKSAGKTPGSHGTAAVDGHGRLLAAAAIGASGEALERAAALIAAGLDLLVVDTAHGHSRNVAWTVEQVRARWPQVTVCAGNVATSAAVRRLAEAGAHVVKVGIGPGSICTTRMVAGVGVPQLTAVLDCAETARELGVTVIADGGLRYSGDLVKALAAGAHAVMLGSLLAGTDEAPGEAVVVGGVRFKNYRGMGSLGAMGGGSKDRYGQQGVENNKLVPEGVEGQVHARGPLADTVHQLAGGIRAGMGYVGARRLDELRTAQFVRITGAGLRESHVHDLAALQKAPNYAP